MSASSSGDEALLFLLVEQITYLRTREPEDGSCLLTVCWLSGSSSVFVMPGAEKANAVAEQHRQYIDQDLVDESPLEALGRNVGAQRSQVPCRPRPAPSSTPNVTARGHCTRGSGGSSGLCAAGRNIAPEKGYQYCRDPPLPSCHRRPRSGDPRAWLRFPPQSLRHRPAARGFGPQSIESPGPAMKPSSDMALLTTTLPLPRSLTVTSR